MKDTKWNKGIETKPIYAILEAVLKAPIDFSDKENNDTKYSQAGAIHIVGNRRLFKKHPPEAISPNT